MGDYRLQLETSFDRKGGGGGGVTRVEGVVDRLKGGAVPPPPSKIPSVCKKEAIASLRTL
jgi:hypothetical protein